MVHESSGSGHVDPVLAATAEDGARDGVEFRRLSYSHVPAQAELVAREL